MSFDLRNVLASIENIEDKLKQTEKNVERILQIVEKIQKTADPMNFSRAISAKVPKKTNK